MHNRCSKCNKKTPLDYTCNYCKSIYCTRCRFPDQHECIEPQDRINIEKEKLAIKLNKEKCVADKVCKI